MSTTTIGGATHKPQQSNATEKSLEDMTSDATVTIVDRFEVEADSLPRPWTEDVAPIHRIPPEILSTIPDFLGGSRRYQDQDIISLTHVCGAWREIFTSRSSLWTDLRCNDTEKTLTYLQRSKSSVVSVSLSRYWGFSPEDPFFQIVPHVIGRLKSLSIDVTPDYLNDIAAHLPNPEPLLERLEIEIDAFNADDWSPPPLPPLLGEDLSSLHNLALRWVYTELPWRNMANLTSFEFWLDSSSEIPLTQLLDFLEGAPRLREIDLTCATPFFDGTEGRLVPLTDLRRFSIKGSNPCAPLLGRLSLPVGVELYILSESEDISYEDHIPESLENLRNLSNFTKVCLRLPRGSPITITEFLGPGGHFTMSMERSGVPISEILDYTTRFGSSTIQQLKIIGSGPLDVDAVHQALLPMQDLRTLILSKWDNQSALIDIMSPQPESSSALICPKLEELVFRPRRSEAKLAIQCVIGMAASRASRGARLKTVKILKDLDIFDPEDLSELKRYVLNVENGHKAAQWVWRIFPS